MTAYLFLSSAGMAWPFLCHATDGSGCPLGGSHSKTAVSPDAGFTSLGCTRKSCLRSEKITTRRWILSKLFGGSRHYAPGVRKKKNKIKIITVIRKTTFSAYVRRLMRKKQVQTLILARPSRRPPSHPQLQRCLRGHKSLVPLCCRRWRSGGGELWCKWDEGVSPSA